MDAARWLQAQSRQARLLAEAAREVGRLEATLAALPSPEAEGALQRLAFIEVEAMLWAQGLVLRRGEIGRDLMEARVVADPEAMRLARWAMRRLEGQGALTNLPACLGLHRRRGSDDEAPPAGVGLRLQGPDFDAAAAEFLAQVDELAALHPLAHGPVVPGGVVAARAGGRARHLVGPPHGGRWGRA